MKKKKKTTKTYQLCVRITEPERQVLSSEGKLMGMGISTYVRKIVLDRKAKATEKE